MTLILLAILAYPLARAIDRYIQRRENAFYLARTRALHNEAVAREAAMGRKRVILEAAE